jgi:hypothetical protein
MEAKLLLSKVLIFAASSAGIAVIWFWLFVRPQLYRKQLGDASQYNLAATKVKWVFWVLLVILSAALALAVFKMVERP